MSGERGARETLRRRERPGRERRVPVKGIRQLPFARIENRYPPIQLLSADELESIHHASLRLLQEVGMEVLHEESRRALKAAGAEVDETNQRVRFDPALIETHVAKAPATFTLEARNPAHNVMVGGPHVIFAATGGPAFASDLDRGRRAGNYQDMCDYIKVVHRLNVIHQEGGCPIEPTDLPAETRHLDFYRAAIALTDKTSQCWALGGYRVEDAVEMACIAHGRPREELKAKPATLTIVNSNSPLRLDIPMGEGLCAMARAGQPVAMTPFTLAGAMSPVTIAG